MANEGQYINPIIEAMVHTARNAQSAKELAEKTRQAKAEEGYRQSQLAQQESQFEKNHELESRRLGLLHDQLQSQMEMQQVEKIKGLFGIGQAGGGEAIRSAYGGQPGQSQGGETPTGSVAPSINIPTVLNQAGVGAGNGKVNIPGMGLVDPNSFGSPEQLINQEGQRAGVIAGATRGAQEPYDEAKAARDFTRAMAMKQYDYEKGIDVEKMRSEGAKEIEKMRSQAMLSATQIRANLGAQLDPDEVANTYFGILNGQTGFSTLPKEMKIAVIKLAGVRGTSLPTNQPQYSAALNNIGGIEDLVRQYKNLALNYSRDAQGSSVLYKMPFGNGTQIPYTELKSKADALRSQGGELASFFDKQNRKSDAEILRQFAGLFDPKSTVKQNQDKIESHMSSVRKAIKGSFAGINPDDVNMVLNNRGFGEIGSLSSTPSSTPAVENWTRDANGKLVKQ